MRKTKRKQKTAGARIVSALSQLADSLDGAVPLGTVRTVELPDEPAHYDADAVRATRVLLRTSQAVFARLLGVSTILVRSWESGTRTPSPLARRLLDEINRTPRRWAALVRQPKRSANARKPRPPAFVRG